MAQKIVKKTRLARRAERKVRLLDAAIAVIAHKGLIGITMNDIAREAGCSYGVVAFHYKSKDGVLLAALDKLVEEYERIWKEHAAAGTGPAVQLRAMLDSDFDRRVGNRGRIAVWSAFWAEAPRNAAYRQEALRYDDRGQRPATGIRRRPTAGRHIHRARIKRDDRRFLDRKSGRRNRRTFRSRGSEASVFAISPGVLS